MRAIGTKSLAKISGKAVMLMALFYSSDEERINDAATLLHESMPSHSVVHWKAHLWAHLFAIVADASNGKLWDNPVLVADLVGCNNDVPCSADAALESYEQFWAYRAPSPKKESVEDMDVEQSIVDVRPKRTCGAPKLFTFETTTRFVCTVVLSGQSDSLAHLTLRRDPRGSKRRRKETDNIPDKPLELPTPDPKRSLPDPSRKAKAKSKEKGLQAEVKRLEKEVRCLKKELRESKQREEELMAEVESMEPQIARLKVLEDEEKLRKLTEKLRADIISEMKPKLIDDIELGMRRQTEPTFLFKPPENTSQ